MNENALQGGATFWATIPFRHGHKQQRLGCNSFQTWKQTATPYGGRA
jgi:hypothetical protein